MTPSGRECAEDARWRSGEQHGTVRRRYGLGVARVQFGHEETTVEEYRGFHLFLPRVFDLGLFRVDSPTL